jgi:transglutaminase/protease-like cytokinesis protein 3
MKSKTKNLSEKEKSYVVFKWECENIEYDAESYFLGQDVDCTPEGVFRNGKTFCSGFSRFFQNVASHLGLNVLCVKGYAKGVGYQPGNKMEETNHEYNVVNIGGNWFVIDCTWGAGHIEGKSYVKEFNEFFFLADPELIIKTHFPSEEKWQLTKKIYTMDDFLRWPKVWNHFYIYGFTTFSPEEAVLELKEENTRKFIIWGDNIKNKFASCQVYFLQGNTYGKQSNLSFIIPWEDRFEINCIFNKKGTYLIRIFGSNNGENNYKGIVEYKVNVENDTKKELKFPHAYSGANAIQLIEPLYNGLKSGTRVKFKMKSDLDTIIIIDGDTWHYLKRNKEGFFEKEIKIQSKPRKTVEIGKHEAKSCLSLFIYDVIS